MIETTPARFKASQYYCHRSYVPTYYWIYLFLEQWIASVVFRNDTSRVFMASDNYAFRRRFELTDMSTSYDDIGASSLQFPFANYAPQNSGWEADDRIAANTAKQVYLGLYVGSTKLRAAAVKHTIPVQFYFDREDDARLAYDRLFFYSYNEHYYSTDVPYGNNSLYVDGKRAPGSTLDLPITITLKNLAFNPTFQEEDWLQKNRIFIIRVNFECRSYIIAPPAQPDYTVNLDSREADNYDDGEASYYPVEDVIFNLANKAWDIETYDGGVDNFPDKGNSSTLYVDSTIVDKDYSGGGLEAKELSASRRYYRWNRFSNSYELYDPYKCDADTIRVASKITQDVIEVDRLYFKGLDSTTGAIKWEVNNIDKLKEIQIHVDNLRDTIILTPDKDQYILKDLIPNSSYYAYVDFIGLDGTVTKLRIICTTKTTHQDTNTSALVGMTW